ncbi:MAG: dienelactone hydrolase family protein [Patescibacteria group bacterium]
MIYLFKRALGISFVLYAATFVVGILAGVLSQQDMASLNTVSDSFWCVGMGAATVLSVLFAFWYFKNRAISASTKSGLLFGLTTVILSFFLDLALFSLGNAGGANVDLLAYYSDPRFWVIIALVLGATTLVGHIKSHPMKRNTMIIAAIGLIVVTVGACAITQYMTDKTAIAPEQKNSEMLKNGNTVAIVSTDNVEYFAGAKGYFVRPEAPGNYPGVVMIHENRGLRSEIRDTAQTLAKEGYLVLAVDLLGGVAEDQDGARALTAEFKQETGTANMRAAVDYLRAQGAQKIASLGWCFGGRQSVELAISGEQLDATVVYYGGGMATSVEKLTPIKWPVLGIFGDKDQAIPVDMVKTFEASLNTLGIKNEIYIYPGVGHAFANPSGMNYAPQETIDAWEKTLQFLKTNLY